MFVSTTLSILLAVLAIGTHATTTLARCNADKYYSMLPIIYHDN